MKSALITGASSGLGLASAKMLASAGYHVIMLCRNHQKAQIALAQVQQLGSGEVVLCDLADLNQVADFTKTFGTRKLDVLMHNAGVVQTKKEVSPQGFEMTMAVNHLAVFLLTHLLLDNLTTGSRIVVVSSGAHFAAKFDLSNWMAENKFSTIQQYGLSKLANILFTITMAKRLEERGITVNAVHPGGVRTGLGDNNKVWYSFLGKFVKLFLMSPERGADTQVWLAADANLKTSGGYYYKRKIAKCSKHCTVENAERLHAKTLAVLKEAQFIV